MDLNRTIFPREEQRSNKAFIMWISTRTDMVHVHWVPNHFIPVLPIDVVHKPSDIEIQSWRLKAQRTKEKVKTEKDMNSNGMFKSAEEEKKNITSRVISGKEYRTFKKENRSIRYF